METAEDGQRAAKLPLDAYVVRVSCFCLTMEPKLTLRNPAELAFSCGRGFSDLTAIVFLSRRG
jgi:hypothetical protein